jgi:hypothetical protein
MNSEELFEEGDLEGLPASLPLIELLLTDQELTYFGPIVEGQWMPSKVKGLWVRVDPARPEIHLPRHVHVAQAKHIKAKDMQASWDIYGRRHDGHRFSDKFGARNNVQNAARQALGLPATTKLESVGHSMLELRRLVEDALYDEQQPTRLCTESARQLLP